MDIHLFVLPSPSSNVMWISLILTLSRHKIHVFPHQMKQNQERRKLTWLKIHSVPCVYHNKYYLIICASSFWYPTSRSTTSWCVSLEWSQVILWERMGRIKKPETKKKRIQRCRALHTNIRHTTAAAHKRSSRTTTAFTWCLPSFTQLCFVIETLCLAPTSPAFVKPCLSHPISDRFYPNPTYKSKHWHRNPKLRTRDPKQQPETPEPKEWKTLQNKRKRKDKI